LPEKKEKEEKQNKPIVQDSIVLLAQEKTAPSSSSHPDDNCDTVCGHVSVCVLVMLVNY
jgi:hypothetical protein